MVNIQTPNKAEVWKRLSEIPDPDIPVLSITELGIVRNVTITLTGKVTVTLTPSYSGCPAMQLFKSEINTALKEMGINNIEIKMVYSPAWTTAWIGESAKKKMKKYGIAPPKSEIDTKNSLFSQEKQPITCPWCNSSNTLRTSQFGSTPCKALWFCNTCKQPFEYFKCI